MPQFRNKYQYTRPHSSGRHDWIVVGARGAISDDDLIAAHQGADFARRGNGHDRKEAAKWARIAKKFSDEIARRRRAR